MLIIVIFLGQLLQEMVGKFSSTQLSKKVVQIDESLLVMAKYHQSCNFRKQDMWIFSADDVNANMFVEKYDAQILFPIIKDIIAPQSTIARYQWTACNNIIYLPNNYCHETVNHSNYFVASDTGVHINNMEKLLEAGKISVQAYE